MDKVSQPVNVRITPSPRQRLRLLASWLWVGLPLGWGVWQTIMKSLPLFDSVGKP
jgi:hypothetical protein